MTWVFGVTRWLIVYVAAVVAATWPLARGLETDLANTIHMCRYDLRLIIWAMSWEIHAITSASENILDANIYHPAPHALLYSEGAYGMLAFFLPVMLATGNPVLSINLIYLGSIALLALGLHRLVERATGSAAAGCIAAGTVLTSPWLLRLWAPAAPNYAVLQWFPLAIGMAATPLLSARRAFVLALVVILQGIVSPYVAPAVLAPLAVLAIWRCVRRPQRPASWYLAAVVVVATAAIGLTYLPNLLLRTAEPRLAEQSVWRSVNDDPATDPRFWFQYIGVAPSAVAVPLLVLIAASLMARFPARGRTSPAEDSLWKHATLWTSTALALMAIRGIHIHGWVIPSPPALLFGSLPALEMFRVPSRLGVAALPGLAVLAGLAFAQLTRSVAGRRQGGLRCLRALCAVVVLVACVASAAAPSFWPSDAAWATELRRVVNAPLPQYPIRPFATAAARRPATAVDVRLRSVEAPLLVLDLEAYGQFEHHAAIAAAMFASIGPWYPLLNGYGGYFPAEYPARMRLAARLPDEIALRDLRRTTGVAWVLVRGRIGNPRLSPWLELKRNPGGQLLRFVVGSEDEMLFAVDPEIDRASADSDVDRAPPSLPEVAADPS